ncbi:MAG: SDR family NAD(P)-dependent oxidoreductase [Chloroflexi bacterium]|nr:SDR family NAD(P)-dependent oxidoreductase [Chloroflexota bacterium]OJW06257.1 MAG: polyketide synthase [Chloroflexi bacterium 54-19]
MEQPIGPDAVFVVSGGGRGITARCVVGLARQYRCKFILLGRSTPPGPEPAWAEPGANEAQLKTRLIETLLAEGRKPTPAEVQKTLAGLLAQREIAQTLREIKEAGAEAEYLSLDITDLAALQVGLAGAVERFGPVTGLIHGAGNLADKLIENKTAGDFERVYTAKVTGLENLLTCLPPQKLSHLVLFSSVAGFYGNSGQTDYALANEILNKTAWQIKRRYPKCRVLALNWGPWDGGMVTPALKEYFASRQVEVIPVEAGTRFLIDELEKGCPETVQLVIGSPLKSVPLEQSSDLRTYRLVRRLSLEANPFLLDHVIGGHPVLPAICAIGWIANACEQLYPGYAFYRAEENKVLKGLVFDETLDPEFTLELKETAKTAGEISFEAIISSQKKDHRPQYHYGSRLTLKRQLPPAPVFTGPRLNPESSLAQAGSDFYRQGTLFHGPTFQGVHRVLEISPKVVGLECYLPAIPESQQGQFPVQSFNPYAVDVQLQGLLIWSRHYYQAASLPLRIGEIVQYRPLPFDKIYYAAMEVQSSSETGLVANVTAFDSSGEIYTVVNGAEVTISPRLNGLFQAAETQPRQLVHKV